MGNFSIDALVSISIYKMIEQLYNPIALTSNFSFNPPI